LGATETGITTLGTCVSMPVSFRKERLLLSKGTGTFHSRPSVYAEISRWRSARSLIIGGELILSEVDRGKILKPTKLNFFPDSTLIQGPVIYGVSSQLLGKPILWGQLDNRPRSALPPGYPVGAGGELTAEFRSLRSSGTFGASPVEQGPERV